jgi:AcrR family transcriptional regulator
VPRKRGQWQSERCTVCAHEKVGVINYSIAKGTPTLAVAKEHGLNPGAVYNHFEKHVAQSYKQIIGAGVYADLDALLKSCIAGDAESLDVLNAMISGHFHQWSLALANGSQAGMTSHAAQLRQLVELRSRITRELAPAQHIGSVHNTAIMLNDVGSLLKILRNHPAACQELVAHFGGQLAPQQIEHAAAD